MSRRQVKQFVVGDHEGADFTQAEIDKLIYEIAVWFKDPKSGRNCDAPVETATARVKECLLAETVNGEPWKTCSNDFAKRILAKCGYDIVNHVGVPMMRAKGRDGGRVLDAKAKEGVKTLNAGAIVQANFDQESYREKVEHDILLAFPELDNAASKPVVRSLSGLYAQREVIDQELAVGVTASKRETLLRSLKVIEDMADTTMKRLGIHPDQIRKKISDKGASTIGDLVALVDEDPTYREREKVWSLQLALQLWWMTEHLNGDKTGPNLHPFEMWHMTRTKPIKFTCRHDETYTIVEGFEPHELYAYLIQEGVLVEEPVVPQLITPTDLAGLDDYFRKDGTDGDEQPEDADDGGDSGGGGTPVQLASDS